MKRTLAYELKARAVRSFEARGVRGTIDLPVTDRLLVGTGGASP